MTGLSGVDPGSAVAVWTAASVVHAVLALALLVPRARDPRRIRRESLWTKPLKFAWSLAMHMATLALALAFVAPAYDRAPALVVTAWASTAAAVLEMAYIVVQAARGADSHFNVGTALTAALYTGMAIGAVVILLAAGVVGAAVILGGSAEVPAAVRHGTALGLLLGTVLTLPVAFTMGARLDRHVGAEPATGRRVPLLGWSLETGDLRVGHFLATHALQAVPVAGLAAAAVLPEGPALAAVWAAAAAWTFVTVEVHRTALGGRPFTETLRRRRAPAGGPRLS